MKVASFDNAEWIDAWRDRRPMTDDPVLVSGWDGERHTVRMSCYNNGEWETSLTVLAWMPRPEAYDPVKADKDFAILIDGKLGEVRFIKE